MDVQLQAPDGTRIPPWADVTARLARQLDEDQQAWLQRLLKDPHQFGHVEATIHQHFAGLADQLVASLLAELGRRGALETPSKKSR